jgi:alpha-L-rhamnosidase
MPQRRIVRAFVPFVSCLFLTTSVVAATAGAASALEVDRLRCEYLENPLGLDECQPRLSWIVRADERGQRQTAYQVLVATSRELLSQNEGDLWDSGRVDGDATVHVAYAGKPLKSRQACHWKVRVWDKGGDPSPWSAAATWTMGLIEPADWTARFISFRDTTPVFKDREQLFLPAARQYRKTFQIDKPIRRATMYSTALGIYELYVNGRRVGDALFAPGWCDYHKRAYYNTYDVTESVRQGANAVGAWVADGWYSGYIGFGLLTNIGTEHIGRYTYGKTPTIMGQLEIEYDDGSRETIVTDSTWKVTDQGPIQEADFLMGEFYDARQEMEGWCEADFDDSSWDGAILAEQNGSVKATFYEFRNPPPGQPVQIEGRQVDLGFKRPPRLEAFPGVPVRPIQEIKAVKMTSPSEGVHILDLGQNIAGVVRLKVRPGGNAGDKIRLRYGEMLHPDGRLMNENLRKARAIDHYVLKGNRAGEEFTPRFTFHGFQYVEITGYPGQPELDAVTGIVLHSDTPLVSEFACSDPMVNQLFQNIVWTQRANFLELPTDCPQRDERFGWTGDAQIYVRAATYNADVGAFYTKWLRDLMESQRPSGTFPGYAPYPFQHGWDFGTAWCDAGVICPWTFWQVYGDTRVIERCWEPMTRFMDWRKSTSKNYLGVVHGNNWGDWLNQNEPTPLDYVDTVYFAYSSRLMSEMAAAIGKDTEATEYRQLLDNIKTAYQQKYLKPDGSLTVDTQTAYAMALFFDLVPERLRPAVGQKLVGKIRDNGTRMATGFLGSRPLLPALSSVGQHDLATVLFQSRKFPSWGYEVEQGATTIWERWDSFTKEDGFGRHNAAMNSFSHYAFGAVCDWMFGQLAGIDTGEPGFQRIVIQPSPPPSDSNPAQEPIHWVKSSYDSIRGPITSHWKRGQNTFTLDTRIPANTTATVYLPARDAASVAEGGQPLQKTEGVRFLRMENNRAVLAIESGSYHFTSQF